MNIGIDIDGVLTDYESFSYDYFSKYCYEHNIKYNIIGSEYETKDTFNVEKSIEKSFWDDYLDFYSSLVPARPFASEIIKKLQSEGNKIYIITARTYTDRKDQKGQVMRNNVENWLKKNNIVYDRIVYCKRPTFNKINEIKEYNIDIMIEDSPKNIKAISKLIPVICYHSEYNKQSLGTNISICYSWYDIYQKVKELKNC